MSVSKDVTALILAAISFPNKSAFQRTTSEIFPFVNIEVGPESYSNDVGTETRTVSIGVTISALDSDYNSMFDYSDTLEADLISIPDLTFTGFSAVNVQFENEVTFITREMSFTYSIIFCL